MKGTKATGRVSDRSLPIKEKIMAIKRTIPKLSLNGKLKNGMTPTIESISAANR
ncbi:hypothetical protein Mcup_0941 [Metallosphaera cuprina Ar-4]|uniref:Uncharacterized protein n=1 Tax=Metallosphaera cuprina (strain Ar-4) TaxID=1006006 RepID=F4G2J8_METCR|nr:hypothetical protein Mcup_0941 [Metallosphaera cuprina Ar-4]